MNTIDRKSVYKYDLLPDDRVRVMMPKGAEILHVDCQSSGTISIWALVNLDSELIERFFLIRGTGHNCDNLQGRKFLGTVLDRQLGLVWHIWYG